MIGPIARWAIKKTLLLTANAIDDKIAANKKAQLEAEIRKQEAEIRKEQEREAADSAYRAYKDAIREEARIAEEKARIAQEVEDRKLARRELFLKSLWWGSLGMYAICVLYRLYTPSIHAYHSFMANILAFTWILTLLVIFYDARNVMIGGSEPYKGLGCGIIILITLCWLGYDLLESIRV